MSLVVSWPRLRLYFSQTRRAARQVGDVEAVDRGEVVIVRCGYHGDYGRYPHWRYMPCLLDLAPDRLVTSTWCCTTSASWRQVRDLRTNSSAALRHDMADRQEAYSAPDDPSSSETRPR